MASCLPGTFNARDVGGLLLTGGGTTRSGVLLRSDALSALSDDGFAALEGIGTVIDLRTAQEREAAPDRLPDSGAIRVLERPLLEGAVTQIAPQAARVMGDGAGGAEGAEGLDGAEGSEGAEGSAVELSEEAVAALRARIPTLDALYAGMLEHGASVFADCARAVAAPTDPRRGGVLLHCTAGKDRTGVAIALLLDVAGVEREAIVADYARSQDELAGEWSERMLGTMRRAGLPPLPEIEQLAVATPPSVIRALLVALDDRGGSAAYLRSGGLSDDELALLRSRLREDAVD